MSLLACGLPRERFDVHVAVLTRSGPYAATLEAAGIPYTLIDKRLKVDFFAYRRLSKLIRSFKPDIVHTWLFAGNAYGRMAAIRNKVPRIIAGERCCDPWKSRLHFSIDEYLEPKTYKIATNSTGIVDFYASHGFDPKKFAVIPNAVAQPQKSSIPREEIFARLGLGAEELERNREKSEREYIRVLKSGHEPLNPRGPYLIGVIARLWPQKRLKEAVWVSEILKTTSLDYHLLVIGDGPERENLLRYRDLMHLADRVHFLGQRNDVSDILPHLDLLWSTSEYEGQSNSILEAMANGIPVIASDIPGNRDLVIPNETGVLIPEFEGDFRRRRSEIAKATLRLLESAERQEEMGKAARKRIEEHFNLQKMIDAYTELYEG